MGKNARKRATRLVALAITQPERFGRVWERRLQSKLFEIHAVAGDLTADKGAFQIVDEEMALLLETTTTGDRRILAGAKSTLEFEAVRAIRLNY
jgi:hypothetical protein